MGLLSGTLWKPLESRVESFGTPFGSLWVPFWDPLGPSGTLLGPSGPPRDPEPQIHPPTSIRNFCSTSTPVWLCFSRRSTGPQRKRYFSGAKRGPELGNEHRSAAKAMPGFGDGGTCTEIIVSLQTGARSPVACSTGNRCNRQPVNRQPVNWQPVNPLGIPQESAGIP